MNLQQLAQEPMECRRNIEISWGWLRATVKLFHRKELQTGHAIFDRTWKFWKILEPIVHNLFACT